MQVRNSKPLYHKTMTEGVLVFHVLLKAIASVTSAGLNKLTLTNATPSDSPTIGINNIYRSVYAQETTLKYYVTNMELSGDV